MITVIHIITKLELGGAQENTIYTCRHLDRSRFEVALLYGPGGLLDDDAQSIEYADIQAVPSLVREVRPGTDARCSADLYRRIRSIRRRHVARWGDTGQIVVHTHSSKAGLLGRLAAKAAGVPHVIHSIHGFGFYEGQNPAKHAVFVNAERAAAAVTGAFIGVSRANLAEGRARGIIRNHHRVRLIRSGFDLDGFRAAVANGQQLRRNLGFAQDDEIIVSIANMKPQKDPLTLVAAMARLRRKRPKAVLLFAGDGQLRPQVEAAIEREDLARQFRLLGWRRDVPELMGAADTVVLSSRFEGLPRVAVQSVVARRPFVGTRVDGTPEIIQR